MAQSLLDADGTFVVLRNGQGEYSIWPAKKSIPPGWEDVEFRGSKEECRARVDEAWTDLYIRRRTG